MTENVGENERNDVKEIISLFKDVFEGMRGWSIALGDVKKGEIASRLTQSLWITRHGINSSVYIQEIPVITQNVDKRSSY